jgi:hypothetical protein
MASQKPLKAVPLYTAVNPQLQAAYVSCHAEGHQWRYTGKLGGSEPGARPPGGAVDSVATLWQCVNCTEERERWYDRRGNMTPRYRQPEGYSYKRMSPDDDAAPTRADWRQRLVVTLFDDMTPTAKRQPRKQA